VLGGAAGIGGVGEAVLGAELAVDAIEDGAEFLGRVGVEHRAPVVSVMVSRAYSPAVLRPLFAFHRADNDGVGGAAVGRTASCGQHRSRAAGRLAGVGDQD